MTELLLIRPAHEADSEFIAGLVPSLLAFGSPAWDDTERFGPGSSAGFYRSLGYFAESICLIKPLD